MRKIGTVRKLGVEELTAYGVRLLGGRALSTGELRTKLLRRAESADDVEGTIRKLKDYGYLNDAQFAEGYATARKDSGSFGRQRVLRDLRHRRVAAPVAERAVNAAYQETDEVQLVRAWLERKYRNVRLAEYLQVEKHLASVYRKLRYAGFSSGASVRALKEFASRADELSGEETGEE